MRRLLPFILLLALCCSSEGQITQWYAAVAKKKVAAPACTFIINEGFEGVGTPSGWGGSANFNSVVSPLVGLQSCRMTGTEEAYTPTNSETEIYLKFRFRVSNLPASPDNICTIRAAGETPILYFYLRDTGALQVFDGSGAVGITSSTITGGVAYDVEIHYKVGTGSNNIGSVGFVTAGGSIPVSGPAFAGFTNGVATTNANREVWDIFADITTYDIDQVQLCTSFIP